jgi:hypothetical protein
VRVASYKILPHLTEIGDTGATSAGNHAQGVAVAAHSADIPVTIDYAGMVFALKTRGCQRLWGASHYSCPVIRVEY